MPKTPSYRHRSDKNVGVVTLTDSATGERRDFYLGPYEAPESRERYHRLIAEWEARGRRLPSPSFDHSPEEALRHVQVVEIIDEYREWAVEYYRAKHTQSLDGALHLLREMYGRTPAVEFGPNRLRILREAMIRGDATAKPPRKPWARRYINSQIQRLRHMFKWATARELVPVSVHQTLCTLEPLRRGRCAARESSRVMPVPPELLTATLAHLAGPVKALVELQLLTGARPGELLGIRLCDLKTDDRTKIWSYRPQEHKNAFREHDRIIYFGPRAQDVISPFMTGRQTNACLFSPAEAEAERRKSLTEARVTPASCGNRVGTNRKTAPRRRPADRYTNGSYCRAIQYACEKAFPLPEKLRREKGETNEEWRERLKPGGWELVRAWRREHRWHPHQLRHNAATELRRTFGLEAAQLALGHASAQITDAIYAERDQAKVIEIMRRIG